VIDVTEKTHPWGEIRIGGFQFEPLPTTLPHNCEFCNSRVLRAITEYNRTHDLSVLLEQTCEYCHADHRAEVVSLPTKFDEEELTEALRDFVRTDVDARCGSAESSPSRLGAIELAVL
jgi:uncharacterized Fe-S cluster-containing MiaB family protein